MKSLRSTLMFAGLPVILLLSWWLFTVVFDTFFVPSPIDTVESFITVWMKERFMTDVVPSLLRLFVGLGVSIVLGVTIGIVIGLSTWMRWTFDPLLEFLRAIPATVLIPTLLLIIGINDTMKVTVIVLGCLWPILLNTVAGVRAIDEVLTATAGVYRLRSWRRLRYLILPGASPQIMTGVRQSLAVGLILMVVSEMFASTNGIGYAIIDFQNRIKIPDMWAGIWLLGLIGVALSAGFNVVQKRVLAWYFGLKEASNNG